MTDLLNIGIMGGSFNPVHTGHLMVANYLRQVAGLDDVWLSLSPANPLKPDAHPVDDARRFEMLSMALEGSTGLRAIDTELNLPRPSYTLQLLDTLSTQYPRYKFKLIIGSDNWLIFDRWRDTGKILDNYGVIIYPRPGYDISDPADPRARLVKAPTVDISSTFIRDSIARGIDMNYFLPQSVYNYIKQHNLYI